MVRLPSLSRHREAGQTRDDHGDGRAGATGTAPVADRDRLDETIAYDGRRSAAPVRPERAEAARAAEQAAAQREAAERAADQAETERLTAAQRGETPVLDHREAHTRAAPGAVHTRATPGAVVEREAEPAPQPPAGPRPRSSVLATLSLVTGVVAVIAVLTGALAGYGIALGVLALLLSIGGISATARRHVAGRSEALLGLILGLGAVVVGILALTGSLSWLSADTDTVGRVREWLDSQFVDRF